MIGVGGLGGGIGSSLAGGGFWHGVGQGLITSGLNHAAHSGALGENLAMSLITGRTRHIFGPDAISIGVEGTVFTPAGGGSVGAEGVLILRGDDIGITVYGEGGVGAGMDVGAGLTGGKYYYTGGLGTFTSKSFGGPYVKANLSFTYGADLGRSVSIAPGNKGSIIGLSATVGVGVPSPLGPWNASIELGGGMTPAYAKSILKKYGFY